MQLSEIPIDTSITETSDRFIATYYPESNPMMSVVEIYDQYTDKKETRSRDYVRELRDLLNRLPLD
jgi:hypothetical protein